MPSVKCLEDINVPFLAELRTVAECGNLHKGIGQSLKVLNTNRTKLKCLISAILLCSLIFPNSCLAVGNHKECKELGLVLFSGACYKREEICPNIYTWFDDLNATDPCQPCHPGLCNPHHLHICTGYIHECDSIMTTGSPPPANISTTVNPDFVGTESTTKSSTLQTPTVPTTISLSTEATDSTPGNNIGSVVVVAVIVVIMFVIALMCYHHREKLSRFCCQNRCFAARKFCRPNHPSRNCGYGPPSEAN